MQILWHIDVRFLLVQLTNITKTIEVSVPPVIQELLNALRATGDEVHLTIVQACIL